HQVPAARNAGKHRTKTAGATQNKGQPTVSSSKKTSYDKGRTKQNDTALALTLLQVCRCP
ncbi:MAG: hypothetical protein IJP95_09070, partial [Bacteroidales bacterium]|nr:hypothetical protein [Bacteroidales bacterium]